jgi:hypothetical protein
MRILNFNEIVLVTDELHCLCGCGSEWKMTSFPSLVGRSAGYIGGHMQVVRKHEVKQSEIVI